MLHLCWTFTTSICAGVFLHALHGPFSVLLSYIFNAFGVHKKTMLFGDKNQLD